MHAEKKKIKPEDPGGLNKMFTANIDFNFTLLIPPNPFTKLVARS